MRMGMMAGLAVVLVATPVVAKVDDGGVKAGVDAWTQGDYAAAIAQWRGPAARGDADAQFNLAQAYKLGKGVPVDLKQAEALYATAARAGHLQAADTYGLLLFQSGRREEAMAWIVPSAERGEPRAQYVLGTAHFNGDIVPTDQIRSYALMSLAAGAGLEQAREALRAMDVAIPLADRQQAIVLAGQLEEQARSLRGTQFAAADLGSGPAPQRRVVGTMKAGLPKVKTAAPPPSPLPAPQPKPAMRADAATAGADFARPVVTFKPSAPPSSAPVRASAPAPVSAPAKIAARPAAAPAAPTPTPVATAGAWRVQLGAFAVAGSAEAQWSKLKSRPAFAGLTRYLVKSGGLTRLQAGPFPSKAAAGAACASLAGQACLPLQP